MKFNKNNYILILLYLIVVVFLLLQIYELYETKIEKFVSNIIRNNNIHSITLDPNDNTYDNYYGTFIKNLNNNNINNSLNLFQVDDTFAGNKWNKIKDSNINRTNSIIYDITYDKYKHMLCIGLYYDKNNKPIYSI